MGGREVTLKTGRAPVKRKSGRGVAPMIRIKDFSIGSKKGEGDT